MTQLTLLTPGTPKDKIEPLFEFKDIQVIGSSIFFDSYELKSINELRIENFMFQIEKDNVFVIGNLAEINGSCYYVELPGMMEDRIPYIINKTRENVDTHSVPNEKVKCGTKFNDEGWVEVEKISVVPDAHFEYLSGVIIDENGAGPIGHINDFLKFVNGHKVRITIEVIDEPENRPEITKIPYDDDYCAGCGKRIR